MLMTIQSALRTNLVPFNPVVSEKLTDRGHIKTNNKRWHYLTLHYGSDELKKKAIQCVCSNKMYQTLVYVPVVCLIK